jgi:hypothetical protein
MSTSEQQYKVIFGEYGRVKDLNIFYHLNLNMDLNISEQDKSFYSKYAQFYNFDKPYPISSNIETEEELFLNSLTNNIHYINFTKIYSYTRPIVDLFYANTKIKYFDFHKIVVSQIDNVNDKRVGNFIPAGSYYNSKIYFNVNKWNFNGRNTKKNNEIKNRLIRVFLHEIGHAIDQSSEINKLMKNKYSYNYNKISQQPIFIKLLKQSNYKTIPKISYQNYLCKYYLGSINNSKNLYQDKWRKGTSEAFAESFSILLKWFLLGFDKNDSLLLEVKNSNYRTLIKALMPVLYYLLKNVNWEYVGVPPLLIFKHKHKILKYLFQIEKVPNVLSDWQRRNVKL